MLKGFAKNQVLGLLNIWSSVLVMFPAQGIAATCVRSPYTPLNIHSSVDKVLISDSSGQSKAPECHRATAVAQDVEGEVESQSDERLTWFTHFQIGLSP